jgi:sulfur carrier protein
MQSSQTQIIEIVVNGEKTTVPDGLTVKSLLGILNVDPERVAVELNRSIVRRPEWQDARIEPGAQLEIVQFVGGG